MRGAWSANLENSYLLYLTMLARGQIMFDIRRDRVRFLNALLSQVLRKIV